MAGAILWPHDFNKLVLAMIKKGERTYFKVSVKDDKVSI